MHGSTAAIDEGLIAEGEVVAGEAKGGKKTYRWARTKLKIGCFTDVLPHIGQIVTVKDGKKH